MNRAFASWHVWLTAVSCNHGSRGACSFCPTTWCGLYRTKPSFHRFVSPRLSSRHCFFELIRDRVQRGIDEYFRVVGHHVRNMETYLISQEACTVADLDLAQRAIDRIINPIELAFPDHRRVFMDNEPAGTSSHMLPPYTLPPYTPLRLTHKCWTFCWCISQAPLGPSCSCTTPRTLCGCG